jgi:hypothetical protein
LAVGQESIPKTRYSFLPDDIKLKKHKVNAHREYIQPILKSAAAAPVDPAKTVDELRQLGATMARSSKAAEAQNAAQQEQLAYLKEKDNKKKDKAEKWHGLSRCLVLNAASTGTQVPVEEIPVLYQDVINNEMEAMADKELHSQMVALGHPDVGFAHGTRDCRQPIMAAIFGTEETIQATYHYSLSTKTTLYQKPKPHATSV